MKEREREKEKKKATFIQW